MGHCVVPGGRELCVVVVEYGVRSREREGEDKGREIHSEKRAIERDKEGEESSRVPCRGSANKRRSDFRTIQRCLKCFYSRFLLVVI